jgi:predicted ATPase/DNA-binding CsgD family transcriptional regulator
VIAPPRVSPPVAVLPLAPWPLVGRAREVDEITGLCAHGGARLVTLTGPGGVGKTRLALAVAERLGAAFPDDVLWLDLAPLADAALVLPEIAAALGAPETEAHGAAEAIRRALRGRETLLVLDNLEHLLAAAPDLGALVAGSPGARVLATSREPLGLRWEQVYPVQPLGLPDPERGVTAESVAQAPAVALFVQRARAADPAFDLTDADAAPVSELCRRLDGLPLAIELAAARARLLAPAALLGRLGDRLDLLASRERDRPDRHQTLRAAVSWSFGLLPDDERAVLRRLAVFEGGCRLGAAESVCGDGVADVLGALGSLVDKGLLTRPDAGDADRFRLLETIRAFAAEQLAASGEEPAVRAAHARHYLREAQLGEREHSSGFARVLRDHDNMRAALRWSAESGDTATLAALLGALWPVWFAASVLTEGLAWIDRALAAPGLTPELELRHRLRYGAASLCQRRGDLDRAEALNRATLGDARAAGHDRLAVQAELGLGIVAARRSDPAAARAWFERGLAGARAWGDTFYVVVALNWLGKLAQWSGDAGRAVRLLEEALHLARSTDEPWNPAETLYNLGVLHLASDQADAAQARLLEAARIDERVGDRWGLARCLEALGAVHAGDGAGAGRAVRLLGAAAALRAAIRVEVLDEERARHDGAVELGERILGDAAFAEGWAQGAALSVGEAIGLAAAPRAGSRPAQTARPAAPGGLSEREVEVVALIARGLTSREIAERLVISVYTADTHATHIRDKLGVRSRAEIAAWAVHHGLGPDAGA